jgi:hypothetical protein
MPTSRCLQKVLTVTRRRSTVHLLTRFQNVSRFSKRGESSCKLRTYCVLRASHP